MIRKAVIIVAIVLLLSVVYFWVKQLTESFGAEDRLKMAKSRVELLKVEQEELKKSLAEAHSAEFIELQARNKLNLARSNETVVIIPEVLVRKTLEADNPIVELRVPYWQGWLKLFF